MTPDNPTSVSFMSLSQIREFLSRISSIRDKLMIRILYETGCNISELVEIKVSDVQSNKIRIVDSETNTIRHPKISGKLAKDLRYYIKGNDLKKNSFLISTRQSSKITERRVRQLIQAYSQKFGYGKINPQMFRYYHIAHAYLSGVFQENIAAQLGIKKFRIFQILNQLNITPKQNMYNRFLSKI